MSALHWAILVSVAWALGGIALLASLYPHGMPPTEASAGLVALALGPLFLVVVAVAVLVVRAALPPEPPSPLITVFTDTEN